LGVQLGFNGYGPFGRLPEYQLEAVACALKEGGADEVELMDNVLLKYGGRAVKEIAERSGLQVVGYHAFLEDLVGDGRSTRLSAAREAGARVLLISTGGNRSSADFRRLASSLASLAADAAIYGMRLLFHPHAAEFSQLLDASPTRSGVDVLIEELPSLDFALDLAWLFSACGGEWETTLRGPLSRVEYVHVRDLDVNGRRARLGEGTVPVKEMLGRLSGTKHAILEEADMTLTPVDDVREGLAILSGMVRC
jgi:sugar phosphate isomerase/epimerase